MIRLTAAFLAAALAAPLALSAQEAVPIRAEDQVRLDGLNAAAGEALRNATLAGVALPPEARAAAGLLYVSLLPMTWPFAALREKCVPASFMA